MADGPAINDMDLDVSSGECKGSHGEKSTKKSKINKNQAQCSSDQKAALPPGGITP